MIRLTRSRILVLAGMRENPQRQLWTFLNRVSGVSRHEVGTNSSPQAGQIECFKFMGQAMRLPDVESRIDERDRQGRRQAFGQDFVIIREYKLSLDSFVSAIAKSRHAVAEAEFFLRSVPIIAIVTKRIRS